MIKVIKMDTYYCFIYHCVPPTPLLVIASVFHQVQTLTVFNYKTKDSMIMFWVGYTLMEASGQDISPLK